VRPPIAHRAQKAAFPMAEFVLQIQDIDEQGKDYAFELTSKWLDQALVDSPLRRDPSKQPGRFELHAQKNEREIFVRGTAEVDLTVECARCLRDTPLHVETRITALLSQADQHGAPEEVELDAEDLERARFVGHEVVLDELVREHLLLECPMQPLCAPDCPGIEIPERVRPPSEDFGGDVDPRLLPLKQLRAKLSGNDK
jgi:uncharacterized protein